ncbi:MAG: hypothetical protein LBT53_02280 [Puniceicoccales bacterium]|jgi:hypothetical protein|nr:hypothetical protein [Puniceicoccales bacterium]
MFNIYDQANKATYPDYKSGYWQRQLTPEDAPSREIYAQFTQNFETALNTINSWRDTDFLAGLLLVGDTLFLARAHNGGRDGHDRPQRWTLFLWRENAAAATAASAVDIPSWLHDPAWPAPPNNAPVPLPPVVPTVRYKAPRNTQAASPIKPAHWTPPLVRDGADNKLPPDFSDVLDANHGEYENFPAQLDAGEVTIFPNSLNDVQALWAAWSTSARRAGQGYLLFSTVGGKFTSLQSLPLLESPVLARRAENERLRQRAERIEAAKEKLKTAETTEAISQILQSLKDDERADVESEVRARRDDIAAKAAAADCARRIKDARNAIAKACREGDVKRICKGLPKPSECTAEDEREKLSAALKEADEKIEELSEKARIKAAALREPLPYAIGFLVGLLLGLSIAIGGTLFIKSLNDDKNAPVTPAVKNPPPSKS